MPGSDYYPFGKSSTMKSFEIEQKYRVKNPAGMRRRLIALGARKLGGGIEHNEIYDLLGMLRAKKRILRLRKSGGKARLTLKGPKVQTRYYARRLEIETAVDFFETREILRELGFRVVAKYSKHREVFRLRSCEVVLDRVPGFGWFLEIEGNPRKIREVAAKLAVGPADMEKKSYLAMIFGSQRFGKG